MTAPIVGHYARTGLRWLKDSSSCALPLHVIVRPLRLRLGRIEDELREVQNHFPAINAQLKLSRDDFTDTVRQNMVSAFEFLDMLVDQNVDLFSDEGLEALLQLNHLVLLGAMIAFLIQLGLAYPTPVLR